MSESEVTINAEGLTKAATHLRATLFEFNKTITRFDDAAAAMIEHNSEFITRFESAVEKLKATDGWHFYENEPLESEEKP